MRAVIRNTSPRQIRLYLVVGDKDYVLDRARHFCEILQSAGMAARLEVRPDLGHEVPRDFDRSLTAGLEFFVDSVGRYTPNSAVERPIGSHSLAMAAHHER